MNEMMEAYNNMPPAHFCWLIVASFVAAYVRSFSGFGFALLAVPAFLLVLSPVNAIPVSILIDLIVGLVLFPSNLSTGVDWRSIRWLLISATPFLPLGLLFSRDIPVPVLQGFIGVILLVSTILLAKGYRAKTNPTTEITVFAGALSGFLGGVAGLFGPPVILLYFSSPMGRAISRASMMVFFLPSLFFASGLQMVAGESFRPYALLPALLVPALIGTYLGHKKFLKTDEAKFRRAVFGLLFLLSISLLVKAAL